MPKPYRGIILDADNTLFDFSRSQRESLAEVLSDVPNAGVQATEVFAQANRVVWEQYEMGRISTAELRVKRFRILFSELGHSGNPEVAAHQYLDALASRAYLLPGAIELLETLSRTVPLALGTNGLAAVQRSRIRLSGIGRYLAGVIISEEIGAQKPEPVFFEACLSVLQVDRTAALMFGDSPSSDIRGAIGAGIDACWYNPDCRDYPTSEPHPTWTAVTFAEISALLA